MNKPQYQKVSSAISQPLNASVSPLGFFADGNDRFPYPFIHLKPEKRYPFRAKPPRIGHYREYPPSGSSQVQRIPARVKAEHWSCQVMLSN